MSRIFEISINIIEIFIIMRFLSLYLGFKRSGRSVRIEFLLFGIGISAVLTIVNSIFYYEGFFGIIFIVLFFLFAHCCLNGSAMAKLFLSGLITCVVYLIGFCTGLIITLCGRFDLKSLFTEFGIGRIIWVVFTKFLLLFSTEILLKFRIDSNIQQSDIWLLSIIPFTAMLTTSILMYTSIDNPELQIPMLIASVSVAVSSVLAYVSYIKINLDSRIKINYEILKNTYESEIKNTQNIEELYKDACGVRHDLKQHLAIINGLMHKSIAEAEQYIKDLDANQIGANLSFIKTENNTVDAIINTKLSICRKMGIKTQVRIMKHALDNLKNEEIGILFGNLFDNAIEAAKDSEEKQLTLDVGKKNGYISIFIANSVNKSPFKTNPDFKTTKSNGEMHGFGIKNIKKVVDRRNGIIEFFEQDDMFCCDILI